MSIIFRDLSFERYEKCRHNVPKKVKKKSLALGAIFDQRSQNSETLHSYSLLYNQTIEIFKLSLFYCL